MIKSKCSCDGTFTFFIHHYWKQSEKRKQGGKQGGFMIKEDGLPVGLGFGLAMNEKALGQFSMMTEDEKRQVIDAARGAQTKEQMAQIVKDIADMEFF